MHKIKFVLLSVFMVFALVEGGAGYAQTLEPSYSKYEIGSNFNTNYPAEVALGEPGLSFKYDSTFGTTAEPYFDDATHLNDPRGVGTDGDNVWIVECNGRRALKYANDDTSTVLMQIGKAGYRETDDTSLVCLMDVAVDSAGNIWLADMSRHHVIKYDSSGTYVTELPNEDVSAYDQFISPYGIAVDSDNNVYVSDRDTHQVQVFDNDGNYLTTFGNGPGSGDTQFNNPKHITIDENDILYVADYDNQRVQIFDVIGAPITITRLGSIDLSSMGGYPEGVAVDLSNNRIFIADRLNQKVQVYNATTWASITSISLNFRPYDVAVDNSGNLYATQPNPYSHQVYQYDSNLLPQLRYGIEGVPYISDDYHYNRPSGVAVGTDDSIYFVEFRGQRFYKLNSEGILQWVIGEPGIRGDDNAHFSEPRDMDIDNNGRIYILDAGNCRIQIYNSDGSYYNTLNGNCGDSIGEFNYSGGVAVAPNGEIYVADTDNARVQIYSSNLDYQATLSQTGSAGGNLPFTFLLDVEVDASGNIYVVDEDQNVVHIFNNNLDYQRSLGVYGIESNDFGYFTYPYAVTVDEEGKIYISERGGNRVQVFDNSGAFLTVIGGRKGTGIGQLNNPDGIAVDSQGNLFIADDENHRIQKYTRGVPGWKQVNINGFGDYDNIAVTSLEVFGNYLYAGVIYGGEDANAAIWRMDGKGAWEQVVSEGLVLEYDDRVNDFIKYKNRLYAAVESWNFGVENTENRGIWRSANGIDWNRIVAGGFNDPQNMEVSNFYVFRNTLYATTWSVSSEHGAEIWSTRNGDVGTWNLNVVNGFGNVNNIVIPAMAEYKGCLYAGTYKGNYGIEGAEIWRTCNGVDWRQVMKNGFGFPHNGVISALGVYKNRLYAGTRNKNNPEAGAELWVCRICNGNDWQMVPTGKGFGDVNNIGIYDLFVVGNSFHASLNNHETGLEIWQTFDGRNWIQINPDGFGDSLNTFSNWGSHPSATFRNQLYFGTQNTFQGGEIWKLCCPYNKPRWAWWYSCWAGAPPYQCNLPVNNCMCDIP